MLCQLSYCPLLIGGGPCTPPSGLHYACAPFRPRHVLSHHLLGAPKQLLIQVAKAAPFAQSFSPHHCRLERPIRIVDCDCRHTTTDRRLIYFVSLCGVCFRQKRQNLLNSSRSLVFFLFFVVL